MSKIPEDYLKSIAKKHNVSEAEFDALRLALSGQTAEESSAVLDISAVAVRKRLGAVYQKFSLVGNTPGKLEALRSLLIEKYQSSQTSDIQPHKDWGEAVDVSDFYGREEELEILEQWTVTENCRLIALLGMGGIGKTALSIKLAQRIEPEYDFVIWRSLRSAPPVKEVLADLIKFFSHEQKINLPENVADRTRKLINGYLRENRCLIVLDNLESILQSGKSDPRGTRAGAYKDEYEDYGEFLRLIGKMPHSSCVVLTSREKPKEFASLEGISRPTRVLQLKGLEKEAGKKILEAEGLSGARNRWSELIEHYAGNPLALRIATTTIKELFGSNIERFIDQGLTTFGDIRDLLEEQLERLSDLELEIMFWLAIEREPVSIAKLSENLVVPPVSFKLLEAVESLKRRSLIEIEKNGASFTLQNVIVEYLYDRLVEKIAEDIIHEELNFFNRYALLEATAKDYVREAQTRLILEPIAERLLTLLKSRSQLEKRLQQMIETQKDSSSQPGYAAGNILNLLCLLESNLKDFDFSNLVIRQAYLQNANLQKVNFANSKFAQSTFTKIFGRVLSVAFSPDGQTLAVGDTNGEILVWQIENSELQLRREADSNFIRSLAFSLDGKMLANAGENQTVKIWDLSSGEYLKPLNEQKNQVWSIAFSPVKLEGKIILATGGEDNTVKIWDVDSDDDVPLQTLRGHSGCIRSVTFSPDGKKLASGSEDKTIKIWNVDSGECQQTLKGDRGHRDWIRAVAFSPDGKTLASGSEDKTIKIWNVDGGECQQTLKGDRGHSNWVWSVAFSPDGKTLASGSADCTVKIWQVASGECQKTLQGHSNWVESVAFSPNGQTLASGSTDCTVKIWQVASGKCQKTLQGYSTWMRTIAFSPDGRIIASGGEDCTVRIWDANSGKCQKTLQGHSNWVQSVAFSPDGKYVASSSPDRTIRIWKIDDDGKWSEWRKIALKDGNWARAMSFSPVKLDDRIILATGNEDKTVKIWDVDSGECQQNLPGHSNWVSSVAFSPDGKTLASGSTDHAIKIWNLDSGKCRRTLEEHKTLKEHKSWVRSVAFSPDGEKLASGSADHTIKIWDLSNDKCLKSWQTFERHEGRGEGHEDTVTSVAFSPDGKTLASGSEDRTVKIWSVKDGKCIETFEGDDDTVSSAKSHKRWVNFVAFSPNGETIASTSIDETIKLWDVKTGECINTLRSLRPYEGMDITGIEGVSDAQKETLKALGAISI